MSNIFLAEAQPAPATTARHEPLAVASFFVAFFGLWLVAIPLGHVARRQARQHGASTAFATAALVVGYLSAAVTLGVIAWFAVAFATLPQ